MGPSWALQTWRMQALTGFVLCWLFSMQIHTSRMTMADDVNLEEFVMTKDEFSGADIKAICTEAGLLALRERRMKVSCLFVFCSFLKERLLYSSKTIITRNIELRKRHVMDAFATHEA